MYFDYFGISETPFAITPDPKYLYLSQRHEEALAHLLYGLNEGGGFVVLTGEVGTGKTTICRYLLERLPENVDLALILNPKLSEVELLATVCDELRIEYDWETPSIKDLVDTLNEHLLEMNAVGRRPVLLIDEAQNLSNEVLEQIRLLTNLETAKRKLLQIILVGQPELNDTLGLKEMRQLAERVTAHYHLKSLSRNETNDYVAHRLSVADMNPELFTNEALSEIHRLTKGVPRRINILCDRALLAAYVQEKRAIDKRLIRNASKDVRRISGTSNLSRKALLWGGAGLGLVVAALGLFYVIDSWTDNATPPATSTKVEDPASTKTARPETQPESELRAEENAVPDQRSGNRPEPSVPPPEPMVEDTPPPVIADTAPTTPAPVIELEANESLDAELAKFTGEMESALENLFAMWKLKYTELEGLFPCDKAVDAKLRCLEGQGGLGELIKLNRPALVSLDLRNGQKSHAVVVRLVDGHTVLQIGQQRVSLPPGKMGELWDGSYMILWKPPPGYTDNARPGMSAPYIVWLKQSLANVTDYEAGNKPSDNYDEDLAKAVMAFQKDQSLEADGLAGPVTLIHINTKSGNTLIPTLLDSR